MYRTLLKSKIHRIVVTSSDLKSEGSCAIDENVLEAASIAESEMVHVWNIDSGERLVTSATKGLPGSGIALNGSAARNSVVGDLIIVAAFSQVAQHDALALKPQLVCVYETSRQLRPRLFEAGRAVA